MGQQDVLDLLKKHPKRWFTTKEMVEIIGYSNCSIATNCNRLRKCGFVRWRQVSNTNKCLYRHKS